MLYTLSLQSYRCCTLTVVASRNASRISSHTLRGSTSFSVSFVCSAPSLTKRIGLPEAIQVSRYRQTPAECMLQIVIDLCLAMQLVGCGSTVQIRISQKVVVLRELQRAIWRTKCPSSAARLRKPARGDYGQEVCGRSWSAHCCQYNRRRSCSDSDAICLPRGLGRGCHPKKLHGLWRATTQQQGSRI